MKIYYLQDASGGFEKFAPYWDTINSFAERGGAAVGLHFEKLKKHNDLSLYSLRNNDVNRLLLVKYQGQFCLVDVVLNHDYHKSRFYNNLSLFRALLLGSASVVEATSFNEIVADEEDQPWEAVNSDECAAFIAAFSSADSKKAVEYQHGRLIALNSIQEEVLSTSLPAIVSGPAGSGKSSLALSMLSQYLRDKESDAAFPVIYVTQNANLVARMKDIWHEMVPDVARAERVVFKSYEQMLAEGLHVDQADFVSEQEFLKWYPGFVKSARISSPIDVKTIWIECRIRSGYPSNKEYLALGRRQSSFNEPAARELLCTTYDAFLASISPHQSVPVLDALKGPVAAPYQLFIVDEAQDLSFGQLRRLHELSKGSIVFFLGDHQLLFDTTSRLDYLKSLYHVAPHRAQVIALDSTYRCSKQVSVIANALINIKYRITGGASDKLSGTLKAAEDALLGVGEGAALRYELKDKAKIDALVEQARSSDQCVVITLEEHKKEVHELFGAQALVMTAQNVKGLEFDRVILWRLLDCEDAKKAVRILSTSGSPSGHRAKAGVGDATYEPYCNALITAATRAKNQVVMVQNANRDIEPILTILDEAFRETQKSGAVLSALLPSTREDWVARALELNDSGLKQEALGVYLSHLGGSTETFDAFIHTHSKKPAVAVLDEVVSTSPTFSPGGTESMRVGTGEPFDHALSLLEQVCRGLTLGDADLCSLKKALSSTVSKPTLLGYLVEKKKDLLRQMSDDLLFSIEPTAWGIKLGGKKNQVPLLLHLASDEEHGLFILQRLFTKGFVLPFMDWEFKAKKELGFFSETSIAYFLLVSPRGQTIFRQLVNAKNSKSDAFDMKKMITGSFLMATPAGRDGIFPLAMLIKFEPGLELLKLFITRYPDEFYKIPEEVWKPLIPSFTKSFNETAVLKLLIEKAPNKLRDIFTKDLKKIWTAASEGDIVTIRLYFALGYKLDAIHKKSGYTPAIWAVTSEQLDVLGVLHECGVDLNQPIDNGITAADIALLERKLHVFKKIYSLCPVANTVDLILLAITSDQPEALSFLIEHSDFFATIDLKSLKKLIALCKKTSQVEMESKVNDSIRNLLSNKTYTLSSLAISPLDYAILYNSESCIRVLQSVTANTAMRLSSEQNENLWTPASLLWLNWIRRQSKASEDVGEGKQLDQMTISDFERFVTETICFPADSPKDHHVTFKALQNAWGLQHHEEVAFVEFQRLMDLFARPESHFLFSGAVHAAFIAARSPLPGGLYQNPIARVEHVAQALLPTANAIFADAVNSSIYGGINGAWVGLLPQIKIEELLLADGRIGAFVVGLGEERSYSIVLSYLTHPDVLSDLKPRIVHQILAINKDKYLTYLLRGKAYGLFSHAIAYNKSFLRYPCISASLAVHLGTLEAASIMVPQKEVLQFRAIETLLHDGCGNIDPLNFNIKFMQRIRDAIHTVLNFEASDQGSVILNPTVLLPVALQQMLAVTTSRDPALIECKFNGFHCRIDHEQSIVRLNGILGAYLLRESWSQKGSFVLAFVSRARKVEQTLISLVPKSPNVIVSGKTYSNLDSLLKTFSFESGSNKLLKQYREPYPLREDSAVAVPWDSLNRARLQIGLDSNNDYYVPPLIGSLKSVWKSLKESRERVQGKVFASVGESTSSSDLGFEVTVTEEAEQNESFWSPASLLWLNWSHKISDSSTDLIQAISMEHFECFVNEMLTFPDSLKPEGHVFNDRKVIFSELKLVWGLSENRVIRFEEFQRLMDIFVRPEMYLFFRGAVRAAFMAARFPFEGDLHKNPSARIEHVAQAMLPTASAIFADAVNSSIYGGLNGAWVGFMSDQLIAEFLHADGRIGAFVVGFSDASLITPVISYIASTSTKSPASEVRSDPDFIVEKETLNFKQSSSGRVYVFKDKEYMTIVDAVVCNKSLLLYPCIMASLTLRLHDSEVAAIAAPEIEVPLSIQYSALMRAGCGKIDRAYFNIKFMKRIRNALHDVLTIDRKIDNPAQQKILFESAEGKSALCLPDKVQEVLRLNSNNLFDGFKVVDLLKLYNPNTDFYTNFFHGFHGDITYDITLLRLKCKPIGSYLLRSSQINSSSYILAYVTANGDVQQAEISLSSDGTIICSGHKFPSLRSVLLAYSMPARGATRALLGKAIAAYPMEESIARATPCALLTEVEALSIDDFPLQLRNDLRGVWNSIKQSRGNPLPVTNVALMGKAFISSASAASALASEALSVQNPRDLHGFFSPASLSTAISSQEQFRGYDMHIVASDGNCFFHAVVDQLQQLGIKDESGALYTHELLRGLVANFVATNSALREFFLDDELTELTTLNGWIGHETIQAFANLLKVTCMIIKDEDPANDVIVNPTSIIVSDDTPVLRLYYNGTDHYNSLRTTNASLLGSNFIIPMP